MPYIFSGADNNLPLPPPDKEVDDGVDRLEDRVTLCSGVLDGGVGIVLAGVLAGVLDDGGGILLFLDPVVDGVAREEMRVELRVDALGDDASGVEAFRTLDGGACCSTLEMDLDIGRAFWLVSSTSD